MYSDSDIRIIKKDLIYIIDLPSKLASEKLLQEEKYFGQYGNIKKIIINKRKVASKNSTENITYSAYITYSKKEEAALAILAVDGQCFEQKNLKLSFGMTKYCNSYLRNQKCLNQECLYQHTKAEKQHICYKQDNQRIKKFLNIKTTEFRNKLGNKYSEFVLNLLKEKKNLKNTIFPSSKKILLDIVESFNLKEDKNKINKNQNQTNQLQVWSQENKQLENLPSVEESIIQKEDVIITLKEKKTYQDQSTLSSSIDKIQTQKQEQFLSPIQTIKKLLREKKILQNNIKQKLQSKKITNSEKNILQTFQKISYQPRQQSKYSFAQIQNDLTTFDRERFLRFLLVDQKPIESIYENSYQK